MPENHTLRNLRKTIGTHLHQERLRHGLTLRQSFNVGQELMRQSLISLKWEITYAINLEVLWHISRALNTELGEFFLPLNDTG